jgi:predicted nucleotidyltransferase
MKKSEKKNKKIHFIKNNNLTMKQKQVIAAKINGRLRTNQTIEQINEVKFYLETKNIKVTQDNVRKYFEEYYGETISIATIKRNWNKEVNYDFNDIVRESIPEFVPDDRRIIDEEDFFN